MRGILISLAIVFFCLSTELVYLLSDQIELETGFPLIQRQTTRPPINRSGFGAANYSIHSGENGLDEQVGVLRVAEQVTGVVRDVIAVFGFAYNALKFIINVLFISTAGFYWWAQDNLYLPSWMSATFTILINLNHAFVIYQWLSKTDIRAGA